MVFDETEHYFLLGGGEMGKLVRAKDWSKTPLGDPKNWPQSLRTMVSVVLNNPFPMHITWGNDYIQIYNDGYRPILGTIKHPKTLGESLWESFEEIWPMLQPMFASVMKGETIRQTDFMMPLNRNGFLEECYFDFSYSPIRKENGEVGGVLATLIETTHKKVLEDELKKNTGRFEMMVEKSFTQELEKQVVERTKELEQLNETLIKNEQRYHLMVEEVQDYAILYLNLNGIIENWNKGAEKIKGYQNDEIIGKNFSVFYTEKDRLENLPQTLLKRAATTGKAVQEGWRVRKNGSLFWASVAITAVHDKANNVIRFSKVTHDLTEKKEADDKLKINAVELQRNNEELGKMNKELESFAYISSHDLQEPLRKIQTFCSRILEKEFTNLSESGKDNFERMQKSAYKMQTLIQDLLAYSRTNTAERKYETINLKKSVEEVLSDLSEELEQKLATIHMGEMCEGYVIPFQFRQLVYNLLSNSLKFSTEERPPIIQIKSELTKGSQLDGVALHKEKTYCHICIADNGIGFEPQYAERIFEVFQRLHGNSQYTGTGIGLAIVKKIVDNHHGTVIAKGVLDEGATFDIYLPMGQ